MRIKALLFAAVFLAVSTNVFAFEHLVNENVSTTFTLRDGDNVVFLDNNSAWNIANRLVFGVSLVSGQELSGSLLVNGCAYKLDGYYKEVDFAYVRGVVVKYQGPEQIVRIQGWVDSSPVIARCEDVGSASVVVKDDDKKSQEELDWLAKKAAQQFQYAVRTAKYRDLGQLETVTFFEGPSENFKITKLPEWDFNRVYIQVEPMDGRKLNGHLYSNELDQKLSGWSISIPVNRKTDLPFDFELAFPEYRMVKLKWWATMEAAKEEPIQMSEKSLGGDSVEASYTFNKEIYGTHSVKLKFRKSDFVDGKIPVVKKYDVIPDGVLKIDSLKSYGAIGSVYDVHAEFKDDDTITFALPLDYGYTPGEDSVYVLHQVNGNWVNVPADSVVDGFVYFRTNSFSLLITIVIGIGVGVGACALWDSCRDKVKDVVDWLTELAEDVVCVDRDGIRDLFGYGEKKEDDSWIPVGQGKIDFNDVTPSPSNNPELVGMSWPDGAEEVFKILKSKRRSRLVKRSEGKSSGLCNKDDDSDDICGWEVTKYNLEILLADAILAQRKGFERRFNELSYDKDKEAYVLKTKEIKVHDEYGNEMIIPGGEILFNEYFASNSGFVEKSAWLIKGMNSCMEGVNYTGKYLTNWTNLYENSSGFKNYTSTCKALLNALNYPKLGFDVIYNQFECSTFLAQNFIRDDNVTNLFDSHTEKLIKVSEVMARVSLLAWMDETVFREKGLSIYREAYDGVREWLNFASPFFLRNNAVAKAYAGLSLYEFILSGGSSNLDALNSSLKMHYGENGGYSEGMGYSQYIWDDVSYVLSALKDAYVSVYKDIQIEPKFLKSPDYVAKFSRPVGKTVAGEYVRYGLIPVEIDDGCTYNPDYRVWAKLTNRPEFLAQSSKYPLMDEGKKTVLTAFGFPSNEKFYESARTYAEYPIISRKSLWGASEDGLSIIMVEREDANNHIIDTVTLSMIAESGDLWTHGQAHDQQDNLSITLTSSRDGFIIQDRGYSGFGERNKGDSYHHYTDHNVMLPVGLSQENNRTIPYTEMYSRVKQEMGEIPGAGVSVLLAAYEIKLYVNKDYDFTVEGGNAAGVSSSVYDDKEVFPCNSGIVEKTSTYSSNEVCRPSDDAVINPATFAYKSKYGVIGYTAYTYFSGDSKSSSSSSAGSSSSSASVFNRRSILYFGGSLWVIDRPNASDLTWLANSPISNEWSKIGPKLYGSSDKYFGEDGAIEVVGVSKNILQNGSRADYVYDENLKGTVLSNYAYSIHDADAKTFVMSYAVNDEGFVKTSDQCPADYQCFENAAKDKRLVVPPQGEKFKLCDALPKNECSGGFESTGITMFMKNEDGSSWQTNWVLDGKITETKGSEVKYVESALVSRLVYSARYSDGKTKSGRYQSTYLPANAILLR